VPSKLREEKEPAMNGQLTATRLLVNVRSASWKKKHTWDLVVIGASKTMILGVAVEEHAELEQWVRTVLDSRNHGAWREGGLITVAMMVLWILVDGELSELAQLDMNIGIMNDRLVLSHSPGIASSARFWSHQTGRIVVMT
jgi:hypothetical protein